MGLIFKDVTYKDKLKKFNYEFQEEKITGIIKNDSFNEFIYLVSSLEDKYDGEIINTYKGRNLGIVFNKPEESFIFETVRDELTFGLKKYNYKTKTIDKRIKDALRMVNLSSDYLDQNPFELSSGEQYLLSLGVVLTLNPKLIIIDNISNLDNKNKNYIIKLLRKINTRYKKTIIIVSDDIKLMTSLVDNYLIMHNGKILSTGKKKELLNDCDNLSKAKIEVPRIIEFINSANKKKNTNLTLTFDIKELMKDIYRNVK